MRRVFVVIFPLIILLSGFAFAAEVTPEQLLLYKSLQEQKGGVIPGVLDKKQVAVQSGGAADVVASPSSVEASFTVKNNLNDKNPIRQFGYDYFSLKYQDQADYTNIPVGPDYVLGIGDSLSVFIWGKVQQKFSAAIEKDGSIFLPKSGKVSVMGMTLAQARSVIQKSLATQFANVEVTVTLDQLRTINVYTAGEFRSPGGYRVTSVATLFHVLYLAGGPTKAGSLRNIRLIRNNRTIATIDLYEYLLYGKQFKKIALLEGDTIFVPVIGPTVAISGSVKRPAIYEMNGAASIKSIVEMAGGKSASGINQNVQVQRIDSTGQRVMMDTQTDLSKLSSPARDGDVIVVASVLPAKRKVVTIAGNVKRPGEYALEPGMKIMDLIKKAEGIIPHTYMSRLELDREGPDYDYLKENTDLQSPPPKQSEKDKKIHQIIALNLSKILNNDARENKNLEDGDRVRVLSEADIDPDRVVYIEGMVRYPGKYPLSESMKLADLVFAAGGLKRGAYTQSAEFFRAGLSDKDRMITLNIARLLSNPTDTSNLVLKPDDRLFIKEDLDYNPQRKVRISGQVRYPGIYLVGKDEHLSALIKRAGGFLPNAFLPGIVFTRQTLRQNEQKIEAKTRKIEEKMLLQQEANLMLANRTTEAEQTHKLASLGLVADESGRLIINIDSFASLDTSSANVVLNEGDELTVPAIPSAVQVLGGVYSPGGVVYAPGQPIPYYTSVCGFTKLAAPHQIYVIRANGSVVEDKAYIPELGDSIIVPEEIKKDFDLWKVIVDVSDVISKMAITLSVLNSLKL